jgi:hypothetical protein
MHHRFRITIDAETTCETLLRTSAGQDSEQDVVRLRPLVPCCLEAFESGNIGAPLLAWPLDVHHAKTLSLVWRFTNADHHTEPESPQRAAPFHPVCGIEKID